MNGFWYSDGHLGWPLFAIIVITMLGLLFADLAWRLISIRFGYLFAGLVLAWSLGVTLIVLLWL